MVIAIEEAPKNAKANAQNLKYEAIFGDKIETTKELDVGDRTGGI
jgi:hypothetical protein